MGNVDIDGSAVPVAVIVIVAIVCYLLALLIIIAVHAHIRRRGLLQQAESAEDQPEQYYCTGCCRALDGCCPCGLPSLYAMLKGCCPRRRLTFMGLITCECLRPTVYGSQGGGNAGINLVCCEMGR